MRNSRTSVTSVIFCSIGLLYVAAAANPVQEALRELFDGLTKDDQGRSTVVTHLNTLLSLGAIRPGQTLLHIPEYSDSRGRLLGISMSQNVSISNLDEWADHVREVVHKVDETTTFSMVRRIILATLVKYWLENRKIIPDSSADKLKDLLLQLYDRHRIGTVHKGVMEYLHVSKSGGTSWCHIAELNGCTTERYDKAYVCQIKNFDDKVRWLNMTFHMAQVPIYQVPQYVLKRFSRFGTFRKSHDAASCAARSRVVMARGYTYYSNEYTVHGGHKSFENAHMCADFFNAIVIRNPLQRLISHMKFVMWSMSGDRGYNDTLLFNQMYANRTSEFWQALSPAIVDNYFIRSLLGEKAFHVAVGAVTADMLRLAQHVLVQFDLLLLLEQDMAIKNLITMYGVGWKHSLEEVHDKNAQSREQEFNTTGYIPKDVNRLLEQQSMDMELYEFAQVVAQLDPVVFSVARKAGIHPLPMELTGDSQKDKEPPCGLLRGENNEWLLAALGARKQSKWALAKKMRAGDNARRMKRRSSGYRGHA